MRLVQNIIQVPSSWISDRYGANLAGVTRVAVAMAHSELNDQEACARVREQVLEHPKAARRALRIYRSMRTEYEGDRAYRLLEAAIMRAPVQPVDPSSAKLFSEEEQLGREAIGSAFATLKELVPQLAELEAGVKQELAGSTSAPRWEAGFDDVSRQLRTVVGPVASPDIGSLARSQLALTIAVQYFAILYGDSRYGNLDTPYFSAPARLYIRVG